MVRYEACHLSFSIICCLSLQCNCRAEHHLLEKKIPSLPSAHLSLLETPVFKRLQKLRVSLSGNKLTLKNTSVVWEITLLQMHNIEEHHICLPCVWMEAHLQKK